MENNNLRNPSVPYATNGVPQEPVVQTPTPLFADVTHSAPPAPVQSTTPSLTTASVAAVPTALAVAPLPPAPTPPVNPGSTAPPKKPRNWRKIILVGSFSALFLLFIGAGVLIFEAVSNSGKNNSGQANSTIASTSIPLSEFASSGSLNLLGTQSLAVNGQLRANESFVLTPQAQPGKSERGQLYFDSGTNRLAYFNGNQFVQIPDDTESVLTLQGQSGNITLVGGTGLAVNGTTLTNTGITSLGGTTGDVTLGNGVTIVNGTLSNTGLVGAASGTGISVTNDGAGNITISNTSASTGTAGRIAKFTGVQTIEDSLLSEAGSAVTVNGDLNITGTLALSSALGVNSGGTGATSFTTNGVIIDNGSGALTAVSAPVAGQCLMSNAGAPSFQVCPSSGVTALNGLNGLSGSVTIANASAAGSTITINDASTSQKGIAQFNSTNFSVSSGLVNTIQDIAVASAPTFGRLTLTSSQATSPMLLVNNTNGSGSGNLIDLQLNGASRMAVSPAGNMTLSGTVNGQTISSAANFTGTLAVAGAANLNGGATVTGILRANTITPTSALTVGATNQALTLQGNASTTLSATNGANTSTLSFQSPTANVNYRLLTAAAGTYDICTTVGNCAGVGGGVTTSGGTTNRIPKFTGTQAIGDSIITDNGSTVTIGGVLAVNTITPTGTLTIGSTNQALALQGTTTTLSSTSSGITNSLVFATPSAVNKTITVPNASGTIVVTASGPLAIDAAGNITCTTCATTVSSVTSLNSLTGALSLAYATGSGSTVTIQDASTSQKGVAQFNSTNFSVASGVVNTIQDIAVASAPTFGRLTVTSSQASSAMLLINNTNVGASGNLLDVQLNGSSRLAVTPAGAMTLTGTLNGQTISSAANFTGTLAVTGAASLNGGASVTGTLTANTITPTSSLTVGATNQSFLVQGSSASTITATSGANTTTLAFQTPTAAVTYRFLTAAAGTYDICTTAGNCAGVGGGVTTPGGTTNKLAKFTGSQAIGDSIITDNGATVTIGGTLAVNTLTPTAALTIGATNQNLTMQGATVNLTSTAGGFTNTLTFATPATSSKTITVPNASGTLVVSASGPLAIDAAGNITCATCASTSGVVTSLNSLTGALTIANATTGGSTITINDASTSQKGIAQFNSTNFSAVSGVVNTIQDISVAATPTFGRLTVTSSQASNGMLLINNTNAGASGNLLDVQLNGSSRLAVTPAGAMTVAGSINGQTISSSASFTGSLAVAGAANLNGGASVTGTLTANTITPTSALTVGATTQSFLVQGNASSTITATSGANTTTVAFQTPTASVTYRLLTAAAGTYDICTTAGNCAGVGGGVTTAGGTTNKLAKFTGSQAIGDSIITDNGTTVTIGGTLAVNTITPSAAMTIGATSQNLTLQGATTSLTATSGGITNTLTFATPGSTNKTITIPNATGTVAVSASGPLSVDANGNITCATCVTSGGGGGGVGAVDSLNGLTGALTIANATTGGSTITINDASTSQKGIAQFNSTNFSASGGTINTIQDISVASAPTFGRLTVTSSQASSAMFLINNTNVGASGNLLDVQLNGSSRLAVNPAGAMTLAGTLNGQTISSAASFTGTLAVAGLASLNAGATVTGTLTANTLTPTSSLTVGATNQSFLVQGSATSTITATSGANTTTLAFQSPTAAVTYRFLTAAAGTYDVCTTVGNCASVGGGVTTAGGTTNKLAKFTGAQTLGDSIITDNGSTVTIGGTLAVNTLTPTAALTIGATGQNLTMQGAAVNLTSTSGGITNSLTFATPATTNKTITIPNASGTLVVSASGPLAIDATGNITCTTCVTTSGVVTSLNSLTGALTIANATTGGSTITIDDASTSAKGIAQFNSTNFSASGGVINTIQNINSTAAPTFGQLTLTSSQASAAMLVVNNTNVSASGNLLDLQLNGSSRLAVTPAGAMTVASTINGQTISSAASFTGTLAVAGLASLNAGATVTGTLTANNLTPTSSLTVGATTQSFLVQGSSASTITATSGANTTTLAFQTPTAAVTYRFLTAAAGTYDVCTTVGNCAGVGGGVTTPGGTSGKIAKFTGTGSIGDSIITESGSTISVAGTIAATTALQTPLLDTASAGTLNIGTTNATAINLNQNTNVTGNLDVSGTLAVGTGDAFQVNASGNVTTSGNGTFNGGGLSVGTASQAGTVVIYDGSSNTATLQIANLSVDRAITFGDEAGTVCLQSSTNCGFAPSSGSANYIQNQNGADQASANFRISGTGRANTSITTPLLDAITAGTLNIGTTTATAISLDKATTVTGGLTQSGGTFSLASSASGSITTSGSLTLTASGGSTWSTSTGNLTIQAATTNNLTLQTGGAGTVALGDQNTTTINIGRGSNIARTITIGDTGGGSSAQTLSVGNSGSSSTTAINGGGGITLNAGSNSWSMQGGASSSLSATGGGFTTTIGFTGTPSGATTFQFDRSAAAGTYQICTTAGNCAGLGATLQASYNGGNTILTTTGRDIAFNLADTATDANFTIDLQCDVSCSTNGRFAVQDDGVDVFSISPAGGAALFQPTTNTTSAFNVKNAAGANMLTVDTSNSRVGINLGSNNVPAMSGTGLEVNGGISVVGSQTFTYLTPGGASINTRFGIAPSDPGAFSQQVAIGLSSTAQTTARAVSLFDARTGDHQPTLAVFSPDENGIIGLGWNGSNTTGTLQTIDNSGSTRNIIVRSGHNSASGNSGDLQLNTGDKTGSSGSSGNIYVATGSGSGTNASSGNVYIDTGSKNGSGTTGSVYLGGTNASSLVLGRVGLTTSNLGSLTAGGVLTGNSLSVTTTASITGTTTTGALNVTNNAGVGGTLNVTSSITGGSYFGGGLTDCDASNSKLLWNVSTGLFSCGTDRASVGIRKPADESVNGVTIVQDDDDFSFSIGANETWAFQIFADIKSSPGGDFKSGITAPTGAICRYSVSNMYSNSNFTTADCNDPGVSDHSDTNDNEYIFYGTVVTGATAGTVHWQWAQGTSSGTTTFVREGAQMIAYKLSGADVAEAYYTKDKSVSPGDVVQADGSLRAGVKKTDKPYSQGTLGVVSTEPGYVLGDPKDALNTQGKAVLLALNGRVPVKISNENGPVKAGDYLTASSKPGVAMKATKPGQMIGTALEDSTYSPSGIGVVNVFINPMWAVPDTSGLQLAGETSDLQGQKAATFNQSVNIAGTLTVKDTLSVDPEKHQVVVGTAGGDAYGTILVLGNKTTAGDPAGTNGAMYYNSVSNKFRCFEAGAWKDCVSSGPDASWSTTLLATDTPLPDCTLSGTIRTLGDCMSAGAANRLITKVDLSKATQARVVASGYDPLAGGHIRLQYSSDGKSWKYLNGANGPDLTTDDSPDTSAWSAITPGAKNDVWIRAVVDGSGTLTSLTNVAAQFK